MCSARLTLPTLALAIAATQAHAARLLDVSTLDKDYVVVHISDGDVIHHEGSVGEEILRYTPELNTSAATQNGSWTITSADDAYYGAAGRHPSGVSRKKKLSGHAQMEWIGGDFRYEYTYEHWLFLQLPSSLQQGSHYALQIAAATNSDTASATFTFDIYSSVSQAIHVNLVGHAPDAPHKAADLYSWMGDGGARNYSAFEGNAVYLYDTATTQVTQAGAVDFWMAAGSDVSGANLTGSDVWSVDFSDFVTPGTYRLVVEGVGCSQDFEISDTIYTDPFKVSLLGYFYMRIGEDRPDMVPPPRTPLYIPGVSPTNTKVYLTTLHPFHPEWSNDWDAPDRFAAYLKPGNPPPTNPNAWGGHSDAADWDRNLPHVLNVYDMLLPYLLTDGAIGDDDTGITESGNGIPDIIDEARYEVDFWLRLRDGDGYSHGVSCPNDSNELFQCGPTAIAAWANAANAAMLADAFRVSGHANLMSEYRDAAITAYNYATGLADQMLDEALDLDDGLFRGRDFKMMAAAYLYNVTGDQAYEDVVHAESVCASASSTILNASHNQLFGTAAYLTTPQVVHYPTLQSNMRAQILSEATSLEAGRTSTRPSRRATDQLPSYWRTAHFVDRTIIAHALTDDPVQKAFLRKALDLEADWGLGRNPMNMVQMTTAFTSLASKRSVPEAYTSGMDDGVPGVHPGHTPYMNVDDWAPQMTMGRPSALYENGYPSNFKSTWPRSEGYFPTRWVWAHNEFTPRQTMRGKMALYGYLHALAGGAPPASPTLVVTNAGVAGGSGTVTSFPAGIVCGTDCSETFASGTTVTLTAVPASGSLFAGWSGACYGADLTCVVTMTLNRSVTATFEPIGLTYSLSVSTSGAGTGTVTSEPSGILCGSDCSEAYPSGTVVTLTAIAGTDSLFSGWGGACSGSGTTCSVTMNAARTVTAEFRSALTPTVWIYDDDLANGWGDVSWSETQLDYAGASPVHSGSHAINVTLGGWGALSVWQSGNNIDTYGYDAIKFWVYGGTGSDKAFRFFTEADGAESTTVYFTAVANTWTEVVFPLSELGNPAAIDRLSFMNHTGNAIGMVTFDEIRLEPGAAPSASVAVGDVSTAESDAGTKTLSFAVTLAGAGAPAQTPAQGQ